MELCPKCKRMTAERNHYTGKIQCYARGCYYGNPLLYPDDEEDDDVQTEKT